MALQKTTASINLAGPLDTKTDPKLVPNGAFLSAENVIYKKPGMTNKRPGYDSYSLDVSAPSYAPTFGANTDIKNNVAGHFDQLLLQNNGALYTRDFVSDNWKHISNMLPCSVESKSILANSFSQYDYDYVDFLDYRLFAYVEIEVGKDVGQSVTGVMANLVSGSVKYKVINTESKQQVAEGTIQTFKSIPSSLNNRSLGAVRCLKSSANELFVVFSYYEGTNQTNYIKSSKLDTSYAVSSTLTLDSNVLNYSYYFDALMLPSTSSVGELIAVASNEGGTITTRFVTTGNALSSQPSITSSVASTFPTLYYNESISNAEIYIAYALSTAPSLTVIDDGVISLEKYTLSPGSSTFAWKATHTTDSLLYTANKVVVEKHPSSSSIVVYYDSTGGAAGNSSGASSRYYFPEQAQIFQFLVSSSGVVSGQKTLATGLNIVAKPLLDSSRSTHYLICSNESAEESSYFTLDIFKGLSADRPMIVTRIHFGSAVGQFNFKPLKATLEDGVINGLFGVKQKIESVSKVTISTEIDYIPNYIYSINEINFTLKSVQPVSDIFYNNIVAFPSGLLHEFDGLNLHENNFLVSPQRIIVNALSKNIVATAIAPSGGSNHEVKIQVNHGAAFSSSIDDYFKTLTVSLASGGTLTIVVNPNTPLSPAGGTSVNLNVTIDEFDTDLEILRKMAIEIKNAGFTISQVAFDEGYFSFYTNSSTVAPNPVSQGIFGPSGVITDPASFATETLNILYAAVFEFTDNQGNIHVSSPVFSDSVTVSTSTLTFPSLVISTPQVTNKDIAKVELKVFKTNGVDTEFKLFTSRVYVVQAVNSGITDSISAGGRKFLIEGQPRISLLDTAYDLELLEAQPVIYTNGGVQENVAVSSCKFSCIWNNRLAVVDEDDPFSIAYGKTATLGVSAEFTDGNRVSVALDSQPIKGLASFEDKILFFKDDKFYYSSGDGFNDNATQSSLTIPQLVPSDVGTIDHNSIATYPFGILFKSAKGIYKVDKSLSVQYIGAPVEEYNQYTISSAVTIKDLNEIRFTFSDSDSLIAYNYLLERWSIHSNCGADDASTFGSIYVRVKNNGSVKEENSARWTDANDSTGNTSYNQILETNWIKVKDAQDYQRIYSAMLLGALKSPHTIECEITHNYDETVVQALTFDSSVITGSLPDDQTYQAKFCPARQKCEAIKFKFTVIPNGGSEETLTMSDLALTLGLKAGTNKVKAGKVV